MNQVFHHETMNVVRRCVVSMVFMTSLWAAPSHAATAYAQMFEGSFESKKSYSNPFIDVDVDVVFSRNGKSWRVPAFWHGGGRWTVRFAPGEPGEYAYRLESTDADNPDLNGHPGRIGIAAYSGPNDLLRRGMFRVSKNKRHFEHADGTPFFWLGDTWYTAFSDRLPWEGFKKLTDDRKAKGFTAIQMALMTVSNEETEPGDPGFCNEGGCVWDGEFRSINPRYFDYADRRVQYVVDSGMAPVLFGAWRQALTRIGVDKMKKYWRYVIARYGAYPVFWVAGGEVFDPPAEMVSRFPDPARMQRAIVPGWTEVMRYIRATDPYHHPLSVHEYPPPLDIPIQDESLTDFELFQASHGGWASIATEVAQLNLHYARTVTTKPLVVGETGWENIAKAHLQDFQRVAFWLAMLNGAAGFSYGNTETAESYSVDKPLHRVRYSFLTWEEAMDFPGSYQTGIGAKLLRQYPWWRFKPHPEWVRPAGTTLLEPNDKVNGFDIDLFALSHKEPLSQEELPLGQWRDAAGNWRLPYAAGVPGEVRFVYIPYLGSLGNLFLPPPTVLGLEPDARYRAYYWEPSLGVKVDLGWVAAPSAGALIAADRFAKREKSAWMESGAASSRADGRLNVEGRYSAVLKNVSERDFVVAVDALSHTDAGLMLRYQDPDNYLAAVYSPEEKSVYLIERENSVDGPPIGSTPVSAIGATFRLTAEVRNGAAAVSMTDGERTYATPIVDVERRDPGGVGILHEAGGATQRFANFELRASPVLIRDERLERKLYDAAGRYRGEWRGPAPPAMQGFTSMDDYGKDKHILLGAYRPERLPFVGDWVLVLAGAEDERLSQ